MVLGLAGGILIGAAASLLLRLEGRIAGISGIVAGLLRPARADALWRAAFVAGLLAGGVAVALFDPGLIGTPPGSTVRLVAAGLLVGFGTRLGSGCTSGHGVCGIGRGSPRSIAATLTFMATGILTVLALRLLGAGT
jgi:uncharacterized membrane protein YedE/YeeE